MTDLTVSEPTAVRHRRSGYDPGRGRVVLIVAALVLLGAVALFMTYDLRGSLSYALELRARKVSAMLLVGTGLGVATVLFQTITANRILTPSLIGLDSLYVLLQTTATWALGATVWLSVDPRMRFGIAVTVMVALTLTLNVLFIRRAANDLPLLVLGGVVLGGVFAALSTLAARLLDPNEFLLLVDQLFADFSTADEQLLGISALAILVALVLAWRNRRELDVVALGRPTAINLGVDYDAANRRVMVLVAVLVAVPTALVGPITFLGLLAANLAYELARTFRHHVTIPLAALVASVILVGAQFVLEEFFEFQTRASIVIGFVGGLGFIALVLREARR